jgi:D-alanyl-D-alanine carboxypeptidase/D-alanyl-D-alanine-endopeptidase (penicillin-binding protein 4)
MNRRHFIQGITAALLLVATPSLAQPHGAQKIVDRWAKSKSLRGLRVGVSVVESANGQRLAGRNDQVPMNPASGAKLLTSAAALHLLPLGSPWETRLLGVIEGAELRGPLRLVGGGDPKLLIGHLERLADAVWAAGIRAIPDGLVVHVGRFDSDSLPPAYEQKHTDAGYRPNIGAAASNFGALRVTVKPGKRSGLPVRVTAEGGAEAVALETSARTVKGKSSAITVRSMHMSDGRTKLLVSGTLGRQARAFAQRKRLHEPDRWTGLVLKSLLGKRGVAVGEALSVTRQPVPRDAGPALDTIRSRSLPETLADINTWSNNFMAEMVLKQMGCDEGQPCTWERGVTRVTEVLRGLGVPDEEFKFVNGSGLYRATMVSASSMTTLLVALATDATRKAAFVGSLAVSGKPGTMRRRLTDKGLRGKVLGKTGTLDEVVSLSGYVPTARGRTLAFSVLVNGANPKRTAAIRRKIDQLVRRLIRL